MHYKAVIRSGYNECEDCGGYDWETVEVIDEDGRVFISASGDDHLAGWNSPWLQLEDEKWHTIFETFGHSIEITIRDWN